MSCHLNQCHATCIKCLQSSDCSDVERWRLLTHMCGCAPAQKFLSHCAPDDPTIMAPAQMSVALLRAALKARGLKAAGSKAKLAAELTAARAAETAGEAAGQTPGAARSAAVNNWHQAPCQQLALRHCKSSSC